MAEQHVPALDVSDLTERAVGLLFQAENQTQSSVPLLTRLLKQDSIHRDVYDLAKNPNFILVPFVRIIDALQMRPALLDSGRRHFERRDYCKTQFSYQGGTIVGRFTRFPHLSRQAFIRNVQHKFLCFQDVSRSPMLQVTSKTKYGWVKAHHRNPTSRSHVRSSIRIQRADQDYLSGQW